MLSANAQQNYSHFIHNFFTPPGSSPFFHGGRPDPCGPFHGLAKGDCLFGNWHYSCLIDKR
jgi:hypothetical protein